MNDPATAFILLAVVFGSPIAYFDREKAKTCLPAKGISSNVFACSKVFRHFTTASRDAVNSVKP